MTSPKNIKKKEQVTPAVASSQEVKICMDNIEKHSHRQGETIEFEQKF